MNLVNGLKKYLCPYCYERISADQIKFRASDTRLAKVKDEKLSEYYGYSVSMPPIVPRKQGRFSMLIDNVMLPDQVKDKSTGLIGDIKTCPECHNPLPNFFEKMDSKIISIVGARSSGKTHFITVLIEEIRKHGHQLGFNLFPQDVGIEENEYTSIKFNRDFREPLYGKNQELKQTRATKDLFPLIYELRSDGRNGDITSIYLVFYDTAGETFKSASAIERQANYLLNSAGMIFLFDSFQIPDVAMELKSKGYSIPPSPGDFSDVLDQINQVLERKRLAGPRKKSKIPLALTFSKVDALIKEELIPSDMVLAEPSHHERFGTFNPIEQEEVSEDIQSMLFNWGNAGFVHDMEAIFKNYSYFGISALGSTPSGGHIGEVRPHRVLDPLLWLLDFMDFPLPKTI